MRQTTSTGHVKGVAGIVDLNVFTGTAEEWAALTGKGVQPPQSDKSVFFAQTGKSVGGGFLQFFQKYGDVTVFGYPLTNEQAGVCADNVSRTIQVFERAVMEWHTENNQGVVMLRNLGAEALAKGV